MELMPTFSIATLCSYPPSIFASYMCTILIVLYMASKNDGVESKLINFLPTILWLLFITLPTLMFMPYYDNYFFALQLGCSSITLVALLLSDLASINIISKNSINNTCINNSSGNKLLVGLSTIIAITSICHIYISSEIPILATLSGENISHLRFLANFKSGIPKPVIYLFQSLFILSVPIIFLLFKYNHKISASSLFVVEIFYSIFNGTKLYFVIMVCTLIILYLFFILSARARSLFMSAACLGALVATLIVSSATNGILTYKMDKSTIQVMEKSMADNNKVYPITQLDQYSEYKYKAQEATTSYYTKAYLTLNYLFCRVFLIPAEVSHMHYITFPKYHKFVAIDDAKAKLANEDLQLKASSSIVGFHAYYKKFELALDGLYAEYVKANCSTDADAWARFGFLGVIVVSIVIMITRLALTVLLILTKSNFASHVIYTTALVILSILLPIASLQAIFISNGLGILIVALMAILVFSFKNKHSHIITS